MVVATQGYLDAFKLNYVNVTNKLYSLEKVAELMNDLIMT